MTDTTYNGWANYETWCAALWLDNDLNGYWAGQAEEIMQQEDNDKDNATYELSRVMESYYEEFTPDVEGLYADLLGASLSRINWYEIAEHYIADVDVEPVDDIEE